MTSAGRQSERPDATRSNRKALPFLVVASAYILAHGLTAMLVTPLQSHVLPGVTPFASLLYLPHGVRVLAAWLMGRASFVPLCVGAFLSEALFTPSGISSVSDPTIIVSIIVGAGSAILSFELMALAGQRLYACERAGTRWPKLFIVGVMASVINSAAQSVVFSGLVLPHHFFAVLSVYALGDVLGLAVTALVLMLCFRWLRLWSGRR
ncbi:hypothetical protein GCM10011415_27600 [Salipiger pallidus]|uniref:Uncharacterized protein n=1 Tax=Salipiger pallidus TaxID=1775170 RepID=A0A8J2ZLI8_9RHOB|nr:hypothetical protein [Salipiger pallidus]GGG77201.1 hypothetical protein GCM10011415_27600 [Salipiger pallidus]